MPRPNKLLLTGAALLALAIPAIAQDRPESILPPGFGEPPAKSEPATPAAPQTEPAKPATPAVPTGPAESAGVQEVSALDPGEDPAAAAQALQPDVPDSARRDPAMAGFIDPATQGLPERPWGRMSGKSLRVLLGSMRAPIASRWAHIGLRGALVSRVPAPTDIDAVDWAAERSWLLLRMGEADAARMLVAQVDNDRFTPKMKSVALQTALASSDPAAMCVLGDDLDKLEPNVALLVNAMCAALSGHAERAAADIQIARRRGKLSAIDIALADKVVGAAAETSRAVTIEWEPVDQLNSWRFGLASATAMMPPDRLIDAATPQTRAWLARAPMFNAAARLPSARIAAGLGVFSNAALVDLYSQVYDATDPDTLGSTDAWQLRLAYIGKDRDARLEAMRKLWVTTDATQQMAGRVLLARAARYIGPSDAVGSDAPNLVASLFAGGFDREAARWNAVAGDLDGDDSARVKAMLAVGAPTMPGLDVSKGMVGDYYDADQSEGHYRTNMLIAAMAGLGRIDLSTINSLSSSYDLGLGEETGWTRLIDGAANRGQAGTVIVLSALALQGGDLSSVKPVYMYHITNALRRTGQDYLARMIAAEAVAPTAA